MCYKLMYVQYCRRMNLAQDFSVSLFFPYYYSKQHNFCSGRWAFPRDTGLNSIKIQAQTITKQIFSGYELRQTACLNEILSVFFEVFFEVIT